MKAIFKITFLFLVLILGVATSTAQEKKTVQKATIKTKINCNHCKACASCGGLLERTLLKNKGVQMITLNEKEMTIEVIYNTKKIDLPTIKKAISKLGYDADDVKAEATAYEKLDDCCKA